MVTINNKYLQSQFEAFSKLKSEEEKKAFVEQSKQDFSTLDNAQQQDVQQAFKNNLSDVDNRLKAIHQEIKSIKTLEVYPNSEEEIHLLEALLKKMNIRFAFK